MCRTEEVKVKSIILRKGNILKVLLIGSYPPPHNGVSVHVKRLALRLKQSGCSYLVYDTVKRVEIDEQGQSRASGLRTWLNKHLLEKNDTIIHYHHIGHRLLLAMGLRGLMGGKVVVSIHVVDLAQYFSTKKGVYRWLLISALKRLSCILTVTEEMRTFLLSLRISPQKVRVISPFYLPLINKGDYEKIPEIARRFIRNHKPIISSYASGVVLSQDVDLYGLDMIIELIQRLKKTYPSIGVIISLPDIGDQDRFEYLMRTIEQHGLNDNIFFLNSSLDEVYTIWQRSDVFVRPTNIDTYGVVLAEALYFKIPAVASDVCIRPKGTLLFKNRDIDSFTDTVRRVLDNSGLYRAKLAYLNTPDGIEDTLEVYKMLISKTRG